MSLTIRTFIPVALTVCLGLPAQAAERPWITIDRSDKCEMVSEGGWGPERFGGRLGCMHPASPYHYHDCPGGFPLYHDIRRWHRVCTPREHVPTGSVQAHEDSIRVDGPKGLVTVHDLKKLADEGFVVIEEKRPASGGRVFLRILFYPIWAVANLEWNVAQPLTREALAEAGPAPGASLSNEKAYETLVEIAEKAEKERILSHRPDPALLENLAPKVEERLKTITQELENLK